MLPTLVLAAAGPALAVNRVVRAAGCSDQVIDKAGDDVVFGGPGPDGISSGLGHDVMRGGAGDDDLYVSVVHGDWTLRGGPGNDVLHSENEQAVRYHGGTGNDEITYAGGPGKAFGGEGDDVLTAYFTSTASLHGGPGDDRIDATNYGFERPNPIVCGDGSDTVELDPTDPVNPDCEDVTVNFLGTEGDDDIDGTPYDDTVLAYQGGADTITTYGGDDRVVSDNQYDPVADVIDTGAGDDYINVWQSFATTAVRCGPGDDVVQTPVTTSTPTARPSGTPDRRSSRPRRSFRERVSG